MLRQFAFRSAAALALVASLSAAVAQTNPLTQVPGQPAPVQTPAQVPAEPAPQTDAAESQQAQTTQREATEIIRSLAPIVGGNPNAPVRDVDADGGRRRVRVDYSRTIDLTVFFEYDSAQLTPQARVQLEPLGRALQSKELLPHRFLLAGHTDVVGAPDYNRVLSLQRAAAVRQHLNEKFGIDPQRLVIHGWGFERLKDPKAPRSAVNRRVEVALIAQPDRRSHGPLPLPLSMPPVMLRDTSPVVVERHESPVRVLVDDQRTTVIAGSGADAHVTVVPHAGRHDRISGGLTDPRYRLRSDDLDDFHSTPTHSTPTHVTPTHATLPTVTPAPHERRRFIGRLFSDAPLRQSPASVTYDPVSRRWSDGWN